MADNEKVKFLRWVTQPLIAASAKTQIQLAALRRDFGQNFNTLTVINTSAASGINVYIDGQKAQYVTASNGSFSFDWEYGLIYSDIEIENTDTLNAIPADTIKITVGRTGP